MELLQQLVAQGSRIFRWRSYLPLLVLPFFLLAMRDGEFFRLEFGNVVDTVWESLCIAVAFAGLVLRALVVGSVPSGTSGRNTRKQKAESLNRTGMYSMVRHPLYLANYIICLGILLFAQSLWLLVAGSLGYWLYYERVILAEEDFLARKFGPEYSAWAAATPSVVPNVRLWRRPALPFSLRAALAREYTTAYALIVLLTGMDLVYAFLQEEEVVLDDDWRAFLLAGTLFYLALRFAKKRTRWLHVPGR